MNWKITQIKTLNEPEQGTIVIASFQVSDGTSNVEDDAVLHAVSAENFVPLDSVTEEQVIAWVKEALTPQGAEQYEALVSDKTSAIKPTQVPLPWNN
jgi:hypothetical protein